MYETPEEALSVMRELLLKAGNLDESHFLILRTAPQYCQSAIDFNLTNIKVGGLVHKDKLDGTPYGSQKVKYLCKKLVPEDRKFDLTILDDTEYFQAYQHWKEVSEFYPMEYVLKDCLRTRDGIVYKALVTQPQVWSRNAFDEATKWEKVIEEDFT